MSSLTSGIGGGWFGGESKAKTAEVGAVTEDQLLAAAKSDTGTTGSLGGEVAHGCPRFNVWSREGYVTIYEPGRVGDGLAVMHRGEITKTARECQIEPGRITIKVSGRSIDFRAQATCRKDRLGQRKSDRPDPSAALHQRAQRGAFAAEIAGQGNLGQKRGLGDPDLRVRGDQGFLGLADIRAPLEQSRGQARGRHRRDR